MYTKVRGKGERRNFGGWSPLRGIFVARSTAGGGGFLRVIGIGGSGSMVEPRASKLVRLSSELGLRHRDFSFSSSSSLKASCVMVRN